MHTPYLLNTNKNKPPKSNQRQNQAKTPKTKISHSFVNGHINKIQTPIVYFSHEIHSKKPSDPRKTLNNNTSPSHHHSWAKFLHSFCTVGEDTKTSQKTWVKKLILDLESNAIDPPDFKNKSLRHPPTPRPSE